MESAQAIRDMAMAKTYAPFSFSFISVSGFMLDILVTIR